MQRCSHFSRSSVGNCRFLEHDREHTPEEIGAMLNMSLVEVEKILEDGLSSGRRKVAEGPAREFL